MLPLFGLAGGLAGFAGSLLVEPAFPGSALPGLEIGVFGFAGSCVPGVRDGPPLPGSTGTGTAVGGAFTGAMEGPGVAEGLLSGGKVGATMAVAFLSALGGSKDPSKAPLQVFHAGFTLLMSVGMER